MINIDPPVFGPVRFGMTQLEAVAALHPLGDLSEVGSGMIMMNLETHFSIGVDADDDGHLDWMSTGPRSGPIMFRGVDLAEPMGAVLRELHSLGLQMICDDPAEPAEWVVQDKEFVLELASDWHGHNMNKKRFEGVILMTPAKFEATWLVFTRNPGPYVPA